MAAQQVDHHDDHDPHVSGRAHGERDKRDALHRHAIQVDQVVAPAHGFAVDRMEVKVLEVIGLRHDLGTARRAVDPRIASARIKVPVVVIDERRDIALGVLFEHLGPHLKIGLDVLLRGVLIKAVFDGVRLIRVVTAAQILVLEHTVDHGTLFVGHQAVARSLHDGAVLLNRGVDARVEAVVLLDKTSRLLERNREDFALGTRRDVMCRHKDLGEVHIRGKAECKHRKNSHPAETRGGARRRSTSLLGCTTGHVRVPSAKRRRDYACRQGKHQAAVAQKRGTHGTQHEQQPVVACKEHRRLFARALGIGIATGQATCHELDGLNEQHQKRIGKQYVFGQQRRIVGEHRHKRKEQQDDATDRQAHAQLAQRRYGIGHAGGRDDKLGTGVDGKARIGAAE